MKNAEPRARATLRNTERTNESRHPFRIYIGKNSSAVGGKDRFDTGQQAQQRPRRHTLADNRALDRPAVPIYMSSSGARELHRPADTHILTHTETQTHTHTQTEREREVAGASAEKSAAAASVTPVLIEKCTKEFDCSFICSLIVDY